MIRTNSKEAKEALKNYIMSNYDGTGYDAGTPEAEAQTFEEMALVILADVKRVNGYEVKRSRSYTWQDAFHDWASGLPSLLDTTYHYNKSAVEILGDILKETEDERNKYTEDEAEKMLDRLLYRELFAVASSVLF